VNDDAFDVSLGLSAGYQKYALEVWAGDACDPRTSRVGATATCWKVWSGKPNQASYRLTVPVRDILAGRTQPGPAEVAGVPAACVATSSATAPQVVTVAFMLIDGSANAIALATLTVKYKLSGSPTPDYVFATPGDGQLLLDFGFDASPADQYSSGFEFFCEPSVGCAPPQRLLPGAAVGELGDLRCGSAERSAESGSATGLENGTSYQVAVVSRDTYGNPSALSRSVCQTPVAAPAGSTPANTSEERSSACSFSTRREPLPLVVALGLAVFALGRRRRPAHSSPAKIASSDRSATQVTPSDAP